MKTCFLLTALLLSSATAYCQAAWNGVPENSATTDGKMARASYNLQQAQAAFDAGDLDKCHYFLVQSEKEKYNSSAFFLLLGKWFYASGKPDRAAHYWMSGYKRGCYECKALADNVKTEGKK